MIYRVTEPDETKLHGGWIDRVERYRLEELVNVLDRSCLRGVLDRLARKTTPERIDCSLRDVQRRPPRRFECDRAACLGHDRLETADCRVDTRSGYPHDETRELIEPGVKHRDTRQLENAAERRERQHAIRI